MEELGYVSGIMRVEGLAETTEIAVVHWCLSRALGIFLGRDYRTLQGRVFWGKECSLGHLGNQRGWRCSHGGRRWDVEVKGLCGQPKSSMQPFGGPLSSSI